MPRRDLARWVGEVGPGLANLREANARRIAEAAPRVAEAARLALANVTDPNWRAVLEARADDPAASLAELGAHFGLSKDEYAGRLRRALAQDAAAAAVSPGDRRPELNTG